MSNDDHRRIRHHTKYYLILNDTFYWRGINSILQRCLTHEEAEQVLNDCHSRACGSHLFGMAIAQKILRAGYFWPSIFKYCHDTVNKYPPYQHFYPKKCTHPDPSFLVIVVGPFAKWGIDFTHCNPTSVGGHGYIIVVVDYFTKWAEAMPTYAEDGKIVAIFFFNHLIARFVSSASNSHWPQISFPQSDDGWVEC